MKRLRVMCAVALSGLLALPTTPARAESFALSFYRLNSEIGLRNCTSMFNLAQARAEAVNLGRSRDTANEISSDWEACIAQQKAESRKDFGAASRALKKASAKAALKEHFVLLSVALSAIAPHAHETNGGYAQRQREALTRVEDQWARFEVEN